MQNGSLNEFLGIIIQTLHSNTYPADKGGSVQVHAIDDPGSSHREIAVLDTNGQGQFTIDFNVEGWWHMWQRT